MKVRMFVLLLMCFIASNVVAQTTTCNQPSWELKNEVYRQIYRPSVQFSIDHLVAELNGIDDGYNNIQNMLSIVNGLDIVNGAATMTPTNKEVLLSVLKAGGYISGEAGANPAYAEMVDGLALLADIYDPKKTPAQKAASVATYLGTKLVSIYSSWSRVYLLVTGDYKEKIASLGAAREVLSLYYMHCGNDTEIFNALGFPNGSHWKGCPKYISQIECMADLTVNTDTAEEVRIAVEKIREIKDRIEKAVGGIARSVTVSCTSSLDENKISAGSCKAYANYDINGRKFVVDITSTASWSTSNTTALTVNKGILTTKSVSGDTTVDVRASYSSGAPGKTAVTIKDTAKTITSLAISCPTQINESVSNGGTCAAKVKYSDGTTGGNVAAKWTDNSGALSVSSSGVISTSGISSDTKVTVTGSYTSGSKTVTGSAAVMVKNVPTVTINKLTLSCPSQINESVTNGGTCTAKAAYSDGSIKAVTASWSESSSALNISSTGVVSTNSVSSDAKVTITGKYSFGGKTASGSVIVTVKNIPTLTISKLTLSCPAQVDENASFVGYCTANATYSDGAVKTVYPVWSESSSALSISSSGAISTSSVSSDTTVSVSGKYSEGGKTISSSATVKVKNAATLPPTPSVMSVSPLSVTYGTKAIFTVKGINLPSTLAFWVDNCQGVTPLSGGTSSSRSFSCTPSFNKKGVQNGGVKDKSGGTVLYRIQVTVK